MQIEKHTIDKRTWAEFKDTKLLWWINRSLHLFGWAIVLEVNDKHEVINAFPAKVNFRGFSQEVETENFITLTNYLKENL